MGDDRLWCSPAPINVSATELQSCVRVTLVLDWHPVVALRLEWQQTPSHRIHGGAVSDLRSCCKLIVFDLFDAFDCQGAYIVSLPCTLLSVQWKGGGSFLPEVLFCWKHEQCPMATGLRLRHQETLHFNENFAFQFILAEDNRFNSNCVVQQL